MPQPGKKNCKKNAAIVAVFFYLRRDECKDSPPLGGVRRQPEGGHPHHRKRSPAPMGRNLFRDEC